MHPVVQGVIAAAILVCAAIYVNQNVTCYNFWGLSKGCVIH